MSIKDLMTDDLGKVDEFKAACDDMVRSRYILAEGKIIKILQTVALSTVLQRIIGGALKGFDYGATAREWSADKAPLNEKEHVALVFCILADIDNHKIYLNDFLRKFFWDGDINSSFASFCATLVEPFKNYVINAPHRVEQETGSIDFALLESKAMSLAGAIEKCDAFKQNEKEEYIFMCDNVATKARNDIAGARALAIALGRLVENIPDVAPQMAEVIDELNK